MSTLNVTQRGYSLFLNGKEYTTREQLCQDFKLTEDMLVYRLNTGMALSEALSANCLHSGYNGMLLDFQGLVYSSLKEFCHIHNLDYNKAYYHTKKGVSLEDILNNNLPHSKKAKKLVVNGYEFPSIKSACDYFNVYPSVLRRYLKRGLSVDESLIKLSFKGKEKYNKLATMKKGELQNA